MLQPLGPSPLAAGDGPWWERLPDDFHAREERFAISGPRRAQVALTATADRAVCLATAAALTPVFAPLARRREVERQLDLLEFYARPELFADPQSFFVEPPAVDVERHRVAKNPMLPRGARVEELRFRGAFTPSHPQLQEAYLRHVANRTTRALHVFHGDRPRPCVIALHGFWASPYWVNAFMFELRWFYRLGFDIVLPLLPFHGMRRMERALFSGHGFFTPDLAQTHEAAAHTVSDIRVILRHLLASGAPHVGVTGLSLGGHLTALLASIEPRLAFAIPNVPVVSLVDLLLSWHPLSHIIRRALALGGLRLADARRLVALHHALTYRPALPRDRLVIIAGAGDRLAPPSQARLLWEHWDRPQFYFFPGNHALHLDRGAYLEVLATFFERAGLLG